MSDSLAELDAAKAAGMQTVLLVRPENPRVQQSHHPQVESFFDVQCELWRKGLGFRV